MIHCSSLPGIDVDITFLQIDLQGALESLTFAHLQTSDYR